MTDFILFAIVGFLAQAVDGALGMAYGAISSTVLLSFGVPPAQASAAVHAAEVFTTAASGTAHHYHRNIDWKLFWRLAPFGILGGFLDAAGGGGWGPMVVTGLLGAGAPPRYVIGTVNAAEFLITLAVSITFILALVTGHWQEAGALSTHASSVLGLIVGG